MALPSTGPISLGQVNTELLRSATSPISMGDAQLRHLADKASGAISINDLRSRFMGQYTVTCGEILDGVVRYRGYLLGGTGSVSPPASPLQVQPFSTLGAGNLWYLIIRQDGNILCGFQYITVAAWYKTVFRRLTITLGATELASQLSTDSYFSRGLTVGETDAIWEWPTFNNVAAYNAMTIGTVVNFRFYG